MNWIGENLSALLPDYAGYKRLREGLAIYRKIADTGWPTVPSGSKLQLGDHSGRVTTLRQRLAAEGILNATSNNDQELFDPALEQALKKFQVQNGLEADGILGPQTLQILNISAEQRVRQIIVNPAVTLPPGR